MIVKCKECKKDFSIVLKVERMRSSCGLRQIYFNCQHCNIRYNAYYENNLTNSLQQEIDHLESRLLLKVIDNNAKIKIFEEIGILKNLKKAEIKKK